MAIRYVGQTQNPKVRLTSHLYDSNLSVKRHVCHWIKSLTNVGLKPIIEIVHQGLTKEEANTWEKLEITRLRAQECDLCNHTSGGDSFEYTEEMKNTHANLSGLFTRARLSVPKPEGR